MFSAWEPTSFGRNEKRWFMHILVVFALCWTNTWKNHIFQYFEWILLRQQIFTAYTLLQFVCLFQNAFKIDFLHDYQFKYLIFIKNKTIFLWKSKNSPVLRSTKTVLQEYWFLVLGAIFNLSNFSCSFLHFDARLTFPQARLRKSQPRLQEYWFFVLGAIFNSELFFQFCWFCLFSAILNENTLCSLLLFSH